MQAVTSRGSREGPSRSCKRMSISPGKKRAPRNGEGRPAKKFTEEQRETILAMARVGITHVKIAEVMGTTNKTLRKHCQKELDFGSLLATAAVGSKLYDLAIDGNVAACIFWMKARAGWTERSELNIKDATPPLTLEDRADAGKRLAFLLAVAAHEQGKEVAVQVDAGSMESLTPGICPPKGTV